MRNNPSPTEECNETNENQVQCSDDERNDDNNNMDVDDSDENDENKN